MTAETISVHILGKDYQVACPANEADALIQSAAELDRRMKAIRQSGSVIGVERIAVMAALNLAHELLLSRSENHAVDASLVDDLCQRIDDCFSQNSEIAD